MKKRKTKSIKNIRKPICGLCGHKYDRHLPKNSLRRLGGCNVYGCPCIESKTDINNRIRNFKEYLLCQNN